MSAASDLDQEINKYLPRLNDKQKKTVLNVMKTFATEQKDWWDELSEQQKAAIKEAEEELNAGKGIPHDVVMEKYKKWL